MIRLARMRAVLNELRLRVGLPAPASPLCIITASSSQPSLSTELGRGWDGTEEGSRRGLGDSSFSCFLGAALLFERPVFFLLGLPESRTCNTGTAFEPEE